MKGFAPFFMPINDIGFRLKVISREAENCFRVGKKSNTMREFGITLLITLLEKEKVITRNFVSL